MRNCAQQDYSYQVYQGAAGGWSTVTEIEEGAYPEGCFYSAAASTNGLRRHKTEYCYCRGDLCNGADGGIADTWLIWPAAISSIIAKQIHSHRSA